MSGITNELIYEVLTGMQGTLVDVKLILADHTQQLLRIRNEVNQARNEINGLRGDDLRIEAMQARMESRLERIERRLNLTDA
jgi:septation ring formation regulator EzrA